MEYITRDIIRKQSPTSHNKNNSSPRCSSNILCCI
jgi:hypothetical protein